MKLSYHVAAKEKKISFSQAIWKCVSFHTGLEQIKEIIYRATEVLYKYLDPSHILMKLKSSLILTDDDVHVIKSHPSMEEKVDELLTMLKRKSEEAYFCLMEALRNLRPDLFKEVVGIERACITGIIQLYII